MQTRDRQPHDDADDHIIPGLGSIPIQKLTPAHLQQFYADKLAADCGPRTVQLCHLRLHQALDLAQNLGLVARNVADAVTPPRVPQREMQTWTRDQIQCFLGEAKAQSLRPHVAGAVRDGDAPRRDPRPALAGRGLGAQHLARPAGRCDAEWRSGDPTAQESLCLPTGAGPSVRHGSTAGAEDQAR